MDGRVSSNGDRDGMKIKVKLADGKARTIQHMMCTTFWHPDGTPMSAQQFMEMLFGRLSDGSSPKVCQRLSKRTGTKRPKCSRAATQIQASLMSHVGISRVEFPQRSKPPDLILTNAICCPRVGLG
jgi:hypothetical protein